MPMRDAVAYDVVPCLNVAGGGVRPGEGRRGIPASLVP